MSASFPSPHPDDRAAQPPSRPPLMRPVRGRVLCGVCRGVAIHLGAPVALVRLLFAVMALAFGSGVVAYVFLWVMMPSGDPYAQAAREAHDASAASMPIARGNRPDPRGDGAGGTDRGDGSDGTGSESLATALRRAPRSSVIALTGVMLLALGVTLAVTGLPGSLIVPALLAAAAPVAAWLHANEPGRQLRSLLAGVALLLTAAALFILTNFHTPVQRVHAAALVIVTLAAVGAMLVPWATAMSRRLSREQASKEREEERADMAAHLHDGVLQTLALIQLHNDDPQTVFTLARSQERELRAWLYQERTPSELSVSAGLRELAARVEDTHGRPIEVVTVGDARPSAQTDALLDAAAQALVNAVTHGGEPVSAYCEVRRAGPRAGAGASGGTADAGGNDRGAGDGAQVVDLFVRDHGDGFDIDAVPADRMGIRESIVGRIQRRGGSVEIVSRPGWGTEVRMHMPIGARTEAREDA